MATTTNYGWTTPNDTDLVKDGAAAIRTLGSSIDTTVFNNASAAIAKTLIDAKGDIIGATAADTPARLAVGANGTVLTADSAEATGLKWAAAAGGGSGLTKLVATTFSAVSSYSAPAATFSATYNQYLILAEVTSQSANSDILMRLRVGGADATANDYQNQEVTGSASTAAASGGASTSWNFGSSSTNTRFSLKMNLFDPFSTGQHLHISDVFALNASSAWIRRALGGRYDVGTAYDAFTLYPASGTITGRIAVYGYAL